MSGEWIEHDGRAMPVNGDVYVWVRFRDGKDDTAAFNPMTAEWWGFNWVHSYPHPDCDIIAYRIAEEIRS